MICGLFAMALVILRIGWGLIGSRYSRLGTFVPRPGQVLSYLKGAFSGATPTEPGRNPASAYTTLAMMCFALALTVSGLAMTQGFRIKEIHEIFAYLMLAVIVVHLAGLLNQALRCKDGVWQSMFSGKVSGEPVAALPSARPVAGFLFLLVGLFCAGILWSNYDTAGKVLTIPFSSSRISLGENEKHNKSGVRADHHHEHENDDGEDN